METKEQLVTNIKEWIKIDNEIAQLKSEIKERNNKKKNLTENLVVTMKKNQIDCFDINGGALVYKQNKVKKAINGKSLLAALQNYFNIGFKKGAENPTDRIFPTKIVTDNRGKRTVEKEKFPDELNQLCHDFIVSRGAIPAPLNYKGFPKSICTSINSVITYRNKSNSSCSPGCVGALSRVFL